MPLLAQLNREQFSRAMRDGFASDESAMTLLMVFVIALFLAMAWFYWRNRTLYEPAAAASGTGEPGPSLQLFRDLSRELSLTLRDRWLLIRIARQQSLPTPLTLFVSPRTLRHHAVAYAQSLPAYRRRRLIARVATLRRQVFG